MRYLLDTNRCIDIAKPRPAGVAGRFEPLHPGEISNNRPEFGRVSGLQAENWAH